MARYRTFAATSLINLANELTAYFGIGVEINTSTTTACIFKIAAISDKWIRIYIASSQFYAEYGTVSGGVFTAISPFAGSSTGGTSRAFLGVLTSNNLIAIFTTSPYIEGKIIMVGKRSDNKPFCLGYILTSSSSYTQLNRGYYLDDNAEMILQNPLRTFGTVNNKIIISDVMCNNLITGAEMDGDLLLGVDNLKGTNISYNSYTPYNGSNYLVFPQNLYGEKGSSLGSFIVFDVTD